MSLRMRISRIIPCLIPIILVSLMTLGQNLGIRFESGISWKEAQAKAKAQNKYIFIDCYATWCGPCKWMTKNIYIEKEVGDYFNAHFINLVVQMDRTSNDDKAVQAWYSNAEILKTRYGVNAYPTYLFFAPDGHIVHRFSGTIEDKNEFIVKAGEAMDPEKQYYNLMDQCKSHKEDSAFLLSALNDAWQQYDDSLAAKIGIYYLNCLHDPISKVNVITISRLIRSSDKKNEKAYNIFLNSASKIDKLMKDSLYVEHLLASTILWNEISRLSFNNEAPIYWGEIKDSLKAKYLMLSDKIVDIVEQLFREHIEFEIKTFAFKSDSALADWNNISELFKKKYPGYDINIILLNRETRYYRDKKMWTECANAAYNLMCRYGKELNDRDLDNLAWDCVFLHCNNPEIMFEAIKWMRRAIDLKPNQPENIDTYANLLYKSGIGKDAIIWENKAIDLAIKYNAIKDLNVFKTTLNKMQKGIPTWESTNPAF